MKIKNHLLHNVTQYYEQSTTNNVAKGLVVELVPPYVQSAWRSREERVWAARLVTCCNYFSRRRKKKKKKQEQQQQQCYCLWILIACTILWMVIIVWHASFKQIKLRNKKQNPKKFTTLWLNNRTLRGWIFFLFN